MILGSAVAAAVSAIATPAMAAKPIVMGFSQVGAESEWRTANTN
jgi:simple sugar transport system substrate-binding protein